MNAEFEMLCHRLLSALFNAVYQGLVLTALLWLGLGLVSRMNAATRHALTLATLLVVVVLPAVHFLWPVKSETGAVPQERPVGTSLIRGSGFPMESRGEPSQAPGEIAAAKILENFGEGNPSGPLSRNGSKASSSLSEMLGSKDISTSLGGGSVPNDLPQPSEKEAPSESLRAGQDGNVLPPRTAFLARDTDETFRLARFFPVIPWSWQLSLPGGVAAGLIGFWIVLATARLGNLGWQCCRLASLKRRGAFASDSLRGMFDHLCGEMQVWRKTRLLTCPDLSTPMVAGFRRPAVLLPMKMAQSAREVHLEQILRHELAHVRRGDDWTNLLQQFIQAVLFFHPAIWWLSRRLTIEREIACDDHVLAATRTPREYALFLTEFASRMHGCDWAAAPAAWSNKSQLNERITMILDSKRNSSTRLARASVGMLTTGAALIAVLGFYAGPRLALAEERSNVSSAETAIAGENDRAIEAAVSPAAEVADKAAKEPGIDSRPATSHEPKRGTGLEPVSAIRKTDGLQTRPTLLSSPVVGVPQEPAAVSPPPAPPVLGPSGPRLKTVLGPQPSLLVLPPEVAPVPPRAPVKVTVPVLAQAPAPAAFPQPTLVPRSALRASGKAAADDSIERRLERLERLVESLLAQDKKAPQRSEVSKDFKFTPKGPSAGMALPKDKQMKFELKMPAEGDLDRMHEEAAKQAEHAVRELKRASQELDRAAVEAERRARTEERQLRNDPKKHPLEVQRKVLEAHRKTLEKQMRDIEKRISQLEQEHEQLEAEKPVKKLDRPDDERSPDVEPKRKW